MSEWVVKILGLLLPATTTAASNAPLVSRPDGAVVDQGWYLLPVADPASPGLWFLTNLIFLIPNNILLANNDEVRHTTGEYITGALPVCQR